MCTLTHIIWDCPKHHYLLPQPDNTFGEKMKGLPIDLVIRKFLTRYITFGDSPQVYFKVRSRALAITLIDNDCEKFVEISCH